MNKYITLLACLCAMALQGQNSRGAQEIYKEIMMSLSGLEQLSYSADFEYYDDHQQPDPNELIHSWFCMDGSQYYWKFGKREIQKSPDYLIIADHDKQLLMVDRAPIIAERPAFSIAGLDSLLDQSSSLELLRETESVYVLRIYSTEPGIPYLDMSYNRDKGWFDHISIYFTDFRNDNENKLLIRNKLIIRYSDINKSAALTKSSLDYRSFFTLKDAQLVPVPRFKNYELLNHLTENK